MKEFFDCLKCKECGRSYPKEALHVCEFDFGPLEATYHYHKIKKYVSRQMIESGPYSMWRYEPFLPLEEEPTVGLHTGMTPLLDAKRLAKILGVKALYIKNDTVNFPTLSFKDRVVSVALSRAKELHYEVVSCASTGNLANSLAAHAAANGFKSYVLIPADLEPAKVIGSLVYNTRVIGIKGSYDKVNRLCSEIAGKYRWAFVNVNFRPYYAEGSKTMGFEILEQMGWKIPDHTVICMASGSLLTKIDKAYQEAILCGLVEEKPYAIHGAQASGCNPITAAFKKGTDLIRPIANPNTIAKSLAIGTPADGYYAIQTIRRTGGYAEDVTDQEIIEGIKILAETEGVFAETAGGVTVGCAKKLIQKGYIPQESQVVLCITGNGLKTAEVLKDHLNPIDVIDPYIQDFDKIVDFEK
ncbi:threonine synthase [Methylacidiphilum kamchatkense Kam1]|uniref:Threonine synthase n=1 Tax=Methylacidiphilum kamchatkense Kam1 TaxID=1202785 RepID=A0A0C1UQ91_9BACT|nr:threonine synthase [Methylacidiphilum kamchatkense]KIE58023.1 threonine synthase [Methylacidiphilum kamchatkense Kam1]QDQ42466.1 threonine synthase [Methylacidiphilum kamchatkense Kam1]